MMSKNNTNGRNQFAMLTIDDLVPQDHLVRKIDAALDFEFIYPIVEATYSDLGRPSIDPVILIKLVFIQYLFGIRSMRQTIKEVDTNVAYRWFLGYSFEEKIPHFSTFGKNYVRRFRETTVFEDIFAYILEQAVKAGFVTEDNLYLDSTHIKANANKHKFTKEMTHDEAKAYQDELEDEINRQRIEAGKRPFTLDLEKEVKLKERKISKADPESGTTSKANEKNNCLFCPYFMRRQRIYSSTIITPGNIHDSQVAFQLVKQSKRLFPEINCVVADAGYKTPKFVHFLTHLNLRPCLPYSRPKGKRGYYQKTSFSMTSIMIVTFVRKIKCSLFQRLIEKGTENTNPIQKNV